MKNKFDNIVILFQEIKDWMAKHKKTKRRRVAISLISAIMLGLIWSGYMVVTRTVPMISCTWEAVVILSVPSDKWRFQWLPSEMKNQCQYKLNSRWIPLMKGATDVGMENNEIDEIN